ALPRFARDRALVLDREIGNAAPRIEPVGLRKRRRWTDVEAGAALPAMVPFGRIRFDRKRGEDRAEKQPRPVAARHQIGVLALPPQARSLRQRLLHDGCGVNKNLGVASSLRDQPTRNCFQPWLDDLVVVIALRIDRDRAVTALAQDRERVIVRPVVHPQHDDRAGVWPQYARVAAPFSGGGHPGHVAVGALGDEAQEAFLRLGYGVWPSDSHDIEALRPGGLDQRRLERCGWLVQKSRSA